MYDFKLLQIQSVPHDITHVVQEDTEQPIVTEGVDEEMDGDEDDIIEEEEEEEDIRDEEDGVVIGTIVSLEGDDDDEDEDDDDTPILPGSQVVGQEDNNNLTHDESGNISLSDAGNKLLDRNHICCVSIVERIEDIVNLSYMEIY